MSENKAHMTGEIGRPPESPPISNAADSNKIARDYFDSMLIQYQFIGARLADSKTEILGKTLNMPIMPGGMSAMLLNAMYKDGVAEMARGALQAGTIMWSGFCADEEFERALEVGVPAIRIIKPMQDEERILRHIKHDEEHGALAFSMDIDHGIDDDGGYYRTRGNVYTDLEPKSPEQLKRYVDSTTLPFIAKGVIGPRDAELALEIGAKGILLTHHMGEHKWSVPPLMALQQIRKVVPKDFPVFVDGNITDGADVYKAMALGATGVCVARPLTKVLKQGGADGVTEYLNKMNGELKSYMGMTNVPDTRSFYPEAIVFRNF